MKKYIHNDRGVTLLEILLAITLLSIVFIAFFGFFIQSAKYTQVNKEKLSAVDVAEKIVARIHEGEYQDNTKYEFEEDGFSVLITIDSGPEGLNLKKAAVTVKPKADSEIEQSFQTEMYFEGSP